MIASAWPLLAAASGADDDAYLGRWDVTATGSPSGLPRNCWLEIKRENGVLKGRFNQGGGAVFDLPVVSVEQGELKFQYPQWKTKTPQVWQGAMKGARLVGTAHVDGQTLSWIGVRGPVWPATPPQRKPGKPSTSSTAKTPPTGFARTRTVRWAGLSRTAF